MYYNDLFGINAVIDGFNNEIKKEKKSKMVLSAKPNVNFIENSQLCYTFYAFYEDDFSTFCSQLAKTFTLLDPFWNIIKSIDINPKTISMLKELSQITPIP